MPSTKGIDVVMGCSTKVLFFKSDTSSTDVPAFLQAIKDAGIKKIDTAALYAQSEELLGEYDAAGKYGLEIDTKIPGGMQPGSSTKDQVISIGQNSLRKLKTSAIDILYLHSPDTNVPISSTLAGINELHARGVFRRFGLSNFHPAQVREIHTHCQNHGYVLPTVYQGNYNAFARHYEGNTTKHKDSNEDLDAGSDSNASSLFPLLRALGMSFVAYSPAAGGFLGKSHTLFTNTDIDGDAAAAAAAMGRFNPTNPASRVYNTLYNKPSLITGLERWNAIAHAARISPLAMALRWVRYNSALSDQHGDAMLMGARTPEQILQTAEMLSQGPLPEKVVEEIDSVWESVREEAPVDNFHGSIKLDMERARDARAGGVDSRS